MNNIIIYVFILFYQFFTSDIIFRLNIIANNFINFIKTNINGNPISLKSNAVVDNPISLKLNAVVDNPIYSIETKINSITNNRDNLKSNAIVNNTDIDLSSKTTEVYEFNFLRSLSNSNISEVNQFHCLNPLSQFEIRDLLIIDLPIFNNLHISLTNMILYLINLCRL